MLTAQGRELSGWTTLVVRVTKPLWKIVLIKAGADMTIIT